MEAKSDSHGDHDGPQLRESEIRAAAGAGRRLTRSRARELGLEVQNVAWAEVGGRKDKKRRLAAEEDPEELGSLQKKDLEDQQQEGKQMSVPAGRVGRRRCRSSMISKHDRQLLGEAPWLVHVSSTALDGREILRCSGTVMEIHHDIHPDKDQVFILTSYHVVFCTSEERLYDPMPKLAIHVDKGKYEGKMLFFSERYQFAILTIELESAIKVKPPRDGPRLCYNQKVITLARDTKMSLKLHHGTTMWQEENCFLFVNCKHFACGIGGPVVNPNGDMVGMSCYYDQDLAVISITTIRTCWKMWSEFGCIARPMLGMCFRNVTLLDIVRQDCLSYKYNITNGFIVDEVTDNCNAEKLGVRRGNVIRLLNVKPCNLPEIEDDLLNIGLDFLRKKPVDDFKLEVYDLIGKAKRDIILPFQITKGSEY